MKNKTTKERLQLLVKDMGYGRNKFEDYINIAKGYLSSKSTTITSETLEKVLEKFPDININWLLTGKGGMYNTPTNKVQLSAEKDKGTIPYYADLPISAGEQGLGTTQLEEKPTGFVNIPGISAEQLFPVIGYSMLPQIKPGDVIGVKSISNWKRVDPDRIYLIITTDERMLKRLRIDNDDENILWCVSTNYQEFKIYKNDIKRIYQVVFHGELM